MKERERSREEKDGMNEEKVKEWFNSEEYLRMSLFFD